MKLKKLVKSFLLIVFFTNCATNLLTQNGYSRDILFTPEATLFKDAEYEFLKRETGESSQFYLFYLFPVTPHLDAEYAMSMAVQKVEGGESMMNILIWHETHYNFPLGKVSVLKVEGDVIKFKKKE
jgi:hypothetical protein